MTKSANPDLARSCTDLVLLTLLQQQPMYGYQILTTLQDRGNGEFRFKQGTLYPVLYRMEREGWIEATWEDPPEGKRRKVYRVTDDGRKGLAVCPYPRTQRSRGSKGTLLASIIRE
mgnify:CR=1 FL=1